MTPFDDPLAPLAAWTHTLRASSDAAVVIAADAKESKPRAWAMSRTLPPHEHDVVLGSRCFISWRAIDADAHGVAQPSGRRGASSCEPFVEVQRRAHALHRVAHAHERGGDLGPHPDEHGLGAHEPRHAPRVGEHARHVACRPCRGR